MPELTSRVVGIVSTGRRAHATVASIAALFEAPPASNMPARHADD